jgi:hypothetical protein
MTERKVLEWNIPPVLLESREVEYRNMHAQKHQFSDVEEIAAHFNYLTVEQG